MWKRGLWLGGGTSARLDQLDVGIGSDADDGEKREDFEIRAVVVWVLGLIPGWRWCSCVWTR